MPKPEDMAQGNCLEDAFLTLIEGLYDAPGAPCVLVHGFPHLTRADGDRPLGTLYGHAWLERPAVEADFVFDGDEVAIAAVLGAVLAAMPTVCIDVYKGTAVPAAVYYNVGQIDPHWVARYTRREALAHMMRANTYGPWHDEPLGVEWAK